MKTKLIKLMLATSLCASVSFADETRLVVEMKNMRDSMHQINDGFFYNKKDKILEALVLLENANKIFKTQKDIRIYLPEKVKHMSGVALMTSKKINTNIKKMKKFIKKNNSAEASNAYIDIVNSCTSCHAITRGW